jgi:putative methionine-R-sulfoxide reductase with GAF domain
VEEAQSPVQGVELWVPLENSLVLSAGAYGRHTEFARVSGKSHFRMGEGLPGAVWARQGALVWHDLSTHFVRAEVAAAAGIDAAIGFPWFRGNELAGVVTLLLTASADAAAAIEIWNHDDSVDVLRHGGGLYVKAPELSRLSPLIQFPYAAGLPGLSWSVGTPVVMDDVRSSNEFIRAELASRSGLRRAIGVPLFRQRRVAHVLTLMGSETESFLRAFELFVPGEVGLTTKACFEEPGAFRSVPPGTPFGARKRLALEAKASGMPCVASFGDAGPAILLALPIHDGTRLRAVGCLEL